MNDKRHYIELSYYKIKYDDGKKKYEFDDENSWIISYKKDENCYFCEKKSNNKITKMENVENFIRIWNYDMYNTIHNGRYQGEAKIYIYVENEYYSGYICNETSKISVDIIQKYVCLLKDIIEEKDKDDKKVDEDYNII